MLMTNYESTSDTRFYPEAATYNLLTLDKSLAAMTGYVGHKTRISSRKKPQCIQRSWTVQPPFLIPKFSVHPARRSLVTLATSVSRKLRPLLSGGAESYWYKACSQKQPMQKLICLSVPAAVLQKLQSLLLSSSPRPATSNKLGSAGSVRRRISQQRAAGAIAIVTSP